MTRTDSPVLEIFQQWREQHRQELQRERQAGKKIAGYFCHSLPIELIEACGLTGVRLLEGIDHQSETRGLRFLQRDACSYCKAALGHLLTQSQLDCVVAATTCDQMRRLQEYIREATGLPTLLINAPRTTGKMSTFRLYLQELKLFAGEFIDRPESVDFTEQLRERIRLWNDLRNRLRTIQQAQQQQPPPFTGWEMLELVRTAFFLGPEKMLLKWAEIENLLAARKNENSDSSVRLLVAGSIVTAADRLLFDLVTEGGGQVVTDILCTGVRWFSLKVEKRGDPWENLARAYHEQVLCPYRRPNQALFEFVQKQAREWNVQGVILRTLKFCHPWGFEAFALRQVMPVPVLHVDVDYSQANIGQLRTRVHAFLEMLRNRQHDNQN